MKIENLKPGQVVYNIGRHKMGNTSISTVFVWAVNIIKVDIERRVVTASWNSNKAKEYHEYSWSKWRVKKPKMIRGLFGNYRLARRNE